MTIPRVPLATDYSTARIIKGGWHLAGGHGAIERDGAIADMRAFARAGFTTFDCADIYTGVESLIGDFLRQWPGPHIGIHTKSVPNLDELSRLSRTQLEAGIDRSLARLGVDRLDLVQFHWWDYASRTYLDALGHLTRMVENGKIRLLGLTNFDLTRLEEIVSAGVRVTTHQVQYSLLDRRPASMGPWCAEHDIALLCYGALAGGFLSERWVGAADPGHVFENRSLIKYRLVIDECGGWEVFQRLLDRLATIARRHDSTIGCVAMRWVLDQTGVAAVIAGATSTRHLAEWTRVFDLTLTDTDRDALDHVPGLRSPPGEVYELERDREGPHGRIMRYNLNT